MTTLYVAAGGGGDAIACSILRRATGDPNDNAIIATYAWDRLRIDPLPGPRAPEDFEGLQRLGELNYLFTPETTPLPPSGSTLPRLSGEIPERLALLDPYGGAVGMGEQIEELIGATGASQIAVVDVGGDILGNSADAGLRSPLADSLALAGALAAQTPTEVLIVGPGLDGEVPSQTLRPRLPERPLLRLAPSDVERYKHIFLWHPSEASALVVAAARRMRGDVEVRDEGHPVSLDMHGAEVFLLTPQEVSAHNSLAGRLAPTRRLADAEAIAIDIIGFNELEYERRKAAKGAPTPGTDSISPVAAATIDDFCRAARKRAVDYVTFRRIAEALDGAATTDAVRAYLVTEKTNRSWPLFRLSKD